MTIAGWFVVLGAFVFFSLLVFILSRTLFGKSEQAYVARESSVDWNAIQDPELISYLPDRKINAIKRYRELTLADLKQAKYAVEYITAHPELWKAKTSPSIGKKPDYVDHGEMTHRVPQAVDVDWDAIRDDELQSYLPLKKINAIKRYRELTRVGLAEAKNAIELVMANPDLMEKAKNRSASRLIDTEGAGVRDLIAAGKIDEAVQVYAQFMGVDEYTARDSIEAIVAENEESNNRSM